MGSCRVFHRPIMSPQPCSSAKVSNQLNERNPMESFEVQTLLEMR
uniref:Uncharacterized protein n=1 Tax=Medicago truncatula TaxID=3880 RepID=I3S646_MEDTR|nr:unknown [Medicago truncatula]